MEYRILGDRLDIRFDGGDPVIVSRPQIRQLLAVLLVEADRSISAEALLDRLRDPSDSGDAPSLKQAIYIARRLLPGDRLVTEGGSYRFRVDPSDCLDVQEFRDLAERARNLRRSDPASALETYQQALGLWGEQPLGDLPATISMEPLRHSLLAERGQIREELAEVLLSQGQHRRLLLVGRKWVAEDPLAEHLRGLLMIALYRAGRKGEALVLYEEAVSLLGRGADPGPALQRLADRITRNDPGLDWKPRPSMVPLGTERAASLDIDTRKASHARIYDYYLGGKDNYAVDREAAEEIIREIPEAMAAAHANRAFIKRVVRYLAAEAGIRQFIDIGAGLPTQGNVHEIAQDVIPDAHVVYVDNDPIVLVHGRALLEANPNVAVIQGDLRRPEEVMADARLNELIDFKEPIGLLLVAILHFIEDEGNPGGLVRRLVKFLPGGSHVAISHGYDGGMKPETVEHAMRVYSRSVSPIRSRTPDQLAEFFAGLELLEPGVVWVPQWGLPKSQVLKVDPQTTHFIGAVGRKTSD